MARDAWRSSLVLITALALACAGDDGGDTTAGSSTDPSTSTSGSETSGADTTTDPGTTTDTPTTTQPATDDTADTTAGDDTTTGEPEPDPLELPPSEPPVMVPEGTHFSADISCGPHPETLFDVFLPQSDEPTPLVVYIHGGGFTGGAKEGAYGGQRADELVALVEAGVAFATIDYRLLEEVDDEGVIKPLGDSRYCLQFMRYHAASLNIDPEAIAAYGGSAGAGTSLWLGTHDDMADPASEDPVERRSTRLSAVGIIETQATYDLIRWLDEIFVSYGLTLQQIAMAGLEQRLLSFYGIQSLDQLDTPEIQAYRADVDMLALTDGRDAPVWILSDNQEETFPINTGILFHHPYHAQAVMDAADAVGLETVAYIPVLGIEDPSGETLVEFMLRQLGV